MGTGDCQRTRQTTWVIDLHSMTSARFVGNPTPHPHGVPERPVTISSVGKSTMAATFPKPMLVHCFDPFGKDLPYRKKIT